MHTDAVANVFMTLPAMKTKGGQMEIIKLKTGKCCCSCCCLLLLLLLVPRAVHIKMSDTLHKKTTKQNTGKKQRQQQEEQQEGEQGASKAKSK